MSLRNEFDEEGFFKSLNDLSPTSGMSQIELMLIMKKAILHSRKEILRLKIDKRRKIIKNFNEYIKIKIQDLNWERMHSQKLNIK